MGVCTKMSHLRSCQRRLISEPIERCFDSMAEQVEHASQEVSRSLRFPLTPLEKRAQRNDAPLKRKNGHFFLSCGQQDTN